MNIIPAVEATNTFASDHAMLAAVVMRDVPAPADQLRKFTALASIETTQIIRREPVRFNPSDLNMLIVSVMRSDVDYDYFCCPGDVWWSNGSDDGETLAECFTLFGSEKEIERALITDRIPPADTVAVNVYALELKDGDICLNLINTLYPEQ